MRTKNKKKKSKKRPPSQRLGGYSTVDLRHQLLDMLEKSGMTEVTEDEVWRMKRHSIAKLIRNGIPNNDLTESIARKFIR